MESQIGIFWCLEGHPQELCVTMLYVSSVYRYNQMGLLTFVGGSLSLVSGSLAGVTDSFSGVIFGWLMRMMALADDSGLE